MPLKFQKNYKSYKIEDSTIRITECLEKPIIKISKIIKN